MNTAVAVLSRCSNANAGRADESAKRQTYSQQLYKSTEEHIFRIMCINLYNCIIVVVISRLLFPFSLYRSHLLSI